MGVGLVRSLQPPDILWIHWRVYCSIANTSKWVLFLPPSDVYVRSFLYLLYTLIKLQPTRLPLPWDSPGKSTGVGCHCLLPGGCKDFTRPTPIIYILRQQN